MTINPFWAKRRQGSLERDTASSDEEEPRDSNQPGRPEGTNEENRGPEPMDQNQGIGTDGDESDDGDYVPPRPGNSSNADSDSDSDEPTVFEGDAEENGSDAGYESYGLADP